VASPENAESTGATPKNVAQKHSPKQRFFLVVRACRLYLFLYESRREVIVAGIARVSGSVAFLVVASAQSEATGENPDLEPIRALLYA
jgi:hypothetical protein